MLSLQASVLLVWVPLIVVIFGLAILFGERKLIAAAQKRLGISFLGRHGWAHLPADLVKFWLKQIQSPGTF
jgi:NADH:ubiquinone oxidoreductase subunit H